MAFRQSARRMNLFKHCTRTGIQSQRVSLITKASTATITITTLALTPLAFWSPWGSSSSSSSSSSTNDVAVEVGNRITPSNTSAQSATTAPQSTSSSTSQESSNSRNRSELDDLLDSIFGEGSSKFDPIEQIQRSVPRWLWPNFFNEIVENRESSGSASGRSSRHVRFNREDSAEDPIFIDHYNDLVGWLHHLAPAHSSWLDWSTELMRPFHLSLEDRGSEYSMRVQLKGMSKEDVRVKVNSGVLCVVGHKASQQSRSGETGQYASSGIQEFKQCIRLPKDALIDRIQAKYDNGMLNITIPKSANAGRNGEIRIA